MDSLDGGSSTSKGPISIKIGEGMKSGSAGRKFDNLSKESDKRQLLQKQRSILSAKLQKQNSQKSARIRLESKGKSFKNMLAVDL